MKILYAVQATGNGHIARAIQLVPYFEKYGLVDVFLSGNNSNLNPNLPVKYRSKGISLFYSKKGGLDYYKMFKEFSLSRIVKDAKQLPVERYDLVINDFESITSLACRLKKIKSINFGHQASFVSPKTPMPEKKDLIGEWILKNYATATKYVGLHFEPYDHFIYSPIIKDAIIASTPINKGHVTVYLSQYGDDVVIKNLAKLKDIRFEVFSKTTKNIQYNGNISILPINNEMFNNSMLTSTGIITGAGFETPAEALYLGKKLLCVPIKGQFEQLCNAAAIKQFNVPIIPELDNSFSLKVEDWLSANSPRKLYLTHSTKEIVEKVIEKGMSL